MLIWIQLLALIFSPQFALGANGGATEGLLNKLLAPGPVIEGHKNLEASRCLDCHVPRQGIPDSKCLKCHDAIQAEVSRKSGFHGLSTKTCISCHSDHKGRDYDSTRVDQKTFDHKLTGFHLTGKHAQLKCTECHAEKRKDATKLASINRPNDPHYIGLKVTCVSCHKKDDPHFFTGKWKKMDCGTCHGPDKWTKDVKFSHEKDAHYKLIGKHDKLKCSECHVPKKGGPSIYEWKRLKQDQCLACHQDQHKGKFSGKLAEGGACVKCHTQDSWKIEKFNHDVTGYPLKGKHLELKCMECHKQSKPKLALKDFKFTGLKAACISCHKEPHQFGSFKSNRFKNPNSCTPCHNERTWKETSFDHNRQTSYPILGKHIGLACTKCHVPNPQTGKRTRIYSWPHLTQKTCEPCHKSPHTKTFSPALLKKACTECHTEEGWHILGKRGFRHDKTRFPLAGKHAETSCEQCHKVNGKEVYKFKNADKGFCIDCHQSVHPNQFHKKLSDQSCSNCHGVKNWSERKEFDHQTTAFKLTDAHAKLRCNECHMPTNETFPLLKGETQAHRMDQFIFANRDKQFCVSCHKNPHVGQFNERTQNQGCTTCHTTKDFTHRLPFNHDKTAYPLRGKHTKVSCQKCHTPTNETFPPAHPGEKAHVKDKFLFPQMTSQGCATCHKDPHEGHYGKGCAQCHNENDWKSGAANFHKNFTLHGVHFSIRCNECHAGGRKLAGMSQMCIACHMKDDIHHGALPDCEKCHEQYFWEFTSFKHSMTNFPLRGYHRTIDCSACHRNNIYKGLPSACVNCHLNDALTFSGPGHNPDHSLLLGRNCADCHNQFSFR